MSRTAAALGGAGAVLAAVAGWAVLFSSPQADAPTQPPHHCSLAVAPRSEFPVGQLVVCGPNR